MLEVGWSSLVGNRKIAMGEGRLKSKWVTSSYAIGLLAMHKL